LRSKSSFRSLFVALSLALVSASGCSTTAHPATDSKPVLAALTDNVILPAYRAIDADAEALRTAARDLEAAPSEDTLTRTQSAWRAARKSWRHADAFRFGPVETKHITAAVDFWPAGTDVIDKILADSAPITAESFEALGANAKGFLALEYLLFDNAGGNAAVVATLTGATGARRLGYVTAAADNLKTKTSELLRAWEPSGENFAKDLTLAGESGTSFPSSKAVVDQLVNSSAFAAEVVTNTKIGKPFGKKTGDVPQPDQEEAPRSDDSIDDMLATLDGVRSVYLGTSGGGASPAGKPAMGIGDLVRAKNASLDTRVVAALDEARAKVSAIPPPFRTAIVSQRDPVEQAYQATRAAKNIISVEVASVLGTTLKFNDNDGD
jgi:uncharacterized protein